MPEQWDLLGVNEELNGGTEIYRVRLRISEDRDIDHVFPKAMIDVRAGEYDIDHTTPEGLQQVIDIILHEPHGEDCVELWEAESIDQARVKMLERIERTKNNKVNVNWSGNPKAAKARTLARGVDPAALLMNHSVDEEVKTHHGRRVRVLRGEEAKEMPAQPMAKNIAARRRSLTVTLLDT